MTRIPVIPTIIVGAAILTMIALGFWQLGRAEERDRLKMELSERPSLEFLEYPYFDPSNEQFLYRRLQARCDRVVGMRVIGGKDVSNRIAWQQIAECEGPRSSAFLAQIGVALRPEEVAKWDGGEIEGLAVFGPDERTLWEKMTFRPSRRKLMIVSDEPKSGLYKSKIPNPDEYENTSWAYAGQWFFFSLTALVIYILALRRRRKPA